MGSSTCYSVATSPVTITVQSELNAGSIAADQTICNGATPATITGTSETSTGTISYKWEAAVTPFSTWNEITGATSKDFAPATLTATTEYRRTTVSVMGSSTCYSVATSPVTITVQSELNAGSIAADQTICNGATPATITGTSETSTGTISYKWEAAVSPFSTWDVITNATSKDFAPSTLTATTEYRRTTVSVMGSSTCYSVATSPVTITVQSELNAGSIAADQTICNGATPATITGTSETSTGTISYKWEAAVTPFSTWNEISGATGTNYTPGSLAVTTEYRRTTVSVMVSITCYSVATPGHDHSPVRTPCRQHRSRSDDLQRRNTGNDHRHE